LLHARDRLIHSLTACLAVFLAKLGDLSLELLEGVSGRVVSSISTKSRGEFDFGSLLPGLYFIHLKPYSTSFGQVEGLISVTVDPRAPTPALDLNLNWSSCGLMVMDLRQCPQPELHVKALRGHASEPGARGVRRLEIVLLDVAQNQVAHVSTDRNGDFSFPGPLEGTFALRIEGGGAINPVHNPLHIEPTTSAASLEIEAASAGGCSTVQAK
jgi:hypothetical protein